MKQTDRIIGGGRIIDVNNDGTCRVRLCNATGLPTGQVLAGIKFVSDHAELTAFAQHHRPFFAEISDDELDKMAKQNIYYNSHNPVDIE